MTIDRKLLALLGIISVAMVTGAYAYLALQVTTTLNILGEPLNIDGVAGTGALDDVVCSSNSGTTATCSAEASAGQTGTINVTVDNTSSESILVTPSGLSDNTDVTIASPAAATIEPFGSFMFTFDVSIDTAAQPGSATLTLSFNR